MDKVAEHKKICDGLHELYKQKNAAYGDSSSRTYDEFGIVTYAVRLSDKFNRFTNLVKNPDINRGDESVEDTLLDMANYCMMAVIDERRAAEVGYDPLSEFYKHNSLIPEHIAKIENIETELDCLHGEIETLNAEWRKVKAEEEQ